MEALAVRPDYLDQRSGEQLEAYHDLTTQFAELIEGSMRTEFPLYFDGKEVYGFDGRSMGEITHDALEDAREIAKRKPSLAFEVRRRSFEQDEYGDCLAMASGEGPNTIIVASDFPAELMVATEDEGGYNVSRKQTMLRVITRQANGSITMRSQSLDGSDRTALEAIYSHFDRDPEPGELLGQRIKLDLSPEEQENLTDRLTGIYDRTLSAKYGGEWYGGRRPVDYRNTYDFVLKQHDLVEQTLKLRLRGQLSDNVMYNLAATIQKRFEEQKRGITSIMPRIANMNEEILWREVENAGAEARSQGQSFSACGVTLDAEGMINSTQSQLEQAGLGNKSGEDRYGSLKFQCPKGHWNIRPRNKLIDKCQNCGTSVRC